MPCTKMIGNVGAGIKKWKKCETKALRETYYIIDMRQSSTMKLLSTVRRLLLIIPALAVSGCNISPEVVYSKQADMLAANAQYGGAQTEKAFLELLKKYPDAVNDFVYHERYRTPLQAAAAGGNPAKVKALLAAGAQVDLCEEGHATPLMIASQHGHTEVVRLLLEAGASPNASLEKFTPPLVVAVLKGSADMVRLLLTAGA